MILTVDTTSGSPPYEQIRSQVTKMIASGVLAPGDRLPTIAQLSADLGLANGTVARAYRELEGDRLIVSHRRRGSFVAETASRQPVTEVRDELDAAIERYNDTIDNPLMTRWTQYDVTRSLSQSEVVSSDPARIVSGGAMSLGMVALTPPAVT